MKISQYQIVSNCQISKNSYLEEHISKSDLYSQDKHDNLHITAVRIKSFCFFKVKHYCVHTERTDSDGDVTILFIGFPAVLWVDVYQL